MKITHVVLALSLLVLTVVSVVAVPPGAPADFSMSPAFTTLNIPAGQVGAATINITSLNGFSGDVALALSPTPPSGCAPLCTTWSLSPSTVTLVPGLSGSATLLIVAGTMGGSANITVTGTGGGMTHTSVIQYVIPSAPDFTLTASPSHVVLSAGGSNTTTISVTSSGGFNGVVVFSLSSSAGLVAEIAPQNLTGSGTAVLFLSAPVPGNYTTTVTGTSGLLVHSAAVLTTATDPSPSPNFVVSAVPKNVTVASGSSTGSTITVTSLNGFTGTVTLSVVTSSSVIVASLGSMNLFLQPGTSVSTTLTIAVSSTAAPGTYTVTVTGVGGVLTDPTTVAVTVPTDPKFAVSANPTSLGLISGSSVSSTISVTSLNGFVGQVVLVSVSSPSGLVTSLSPGSVMVMSGTVNSVLSITTTSTTLPGTYSVTVTGTSGSLTEDVTIMVTVTMPTPVPDFTITITPPLRTVRKGQSTTYTITVTGINGFTGAVSLSASVTPLNNRDPVLSYSPLVNSDTNSTLTVSTARHTFHMTYAITVTGTSGTLTHSATAYLTVTN